MAENPLLYGAIAVGLTITGVGITYVIDYERRISLLESRLDALSGIAAATASSSEREATTKPNQGEPKAMAEDTIFSQTIAEGCLKLISSYDEIVASGNIYSGEQGRLDALKAQMSALGCTSLGISQ